MNEFYTKLAGTTFNGRDEVIEELYLSGQLDVGQELILQRQPFNPKDRNAIAVLHPGNHEQLGWIGRQIAETMAPKIDVGTTYRAFVSLVTGGNGYNYGINIKVSEQCLPNVNTDTQNFNFNITKKIINSLGELVIGSRAADGYDDAGNDLLWDEIYLDSNKEKVIMIFSDVHIRIMYKFNNDRNFSIREIEDVFNGLRGYSGDNVFGKIFADAFRKVSLQFVDGKTVYVSKKLTSDIVDIVNDENIFIDRVNEIAVETSKFVKNVNDSFDNLHDCAFNLRDFLIQHRNQ